MLDWFPYNAVAFSFLFFFFFLVFWFLRIISEEARERGLICSKLTMEIQELRHWHYSDLHFDNSGHLFFRLPFQSYIHFNKHCMCSVIKWYHNNWISPLWKSFSSRPEHFFDSEYLSATASIMIISNVSKKPFTRAK